MSWLKSVGSVLGKILKAVATDGEKTVTLAKPIAAALLPQFSTEINAAADMATNVLHEVVAVEGVAAATGAATGTDAKLQTAVMNSGPAIDAWVNANFPGSTQISNASKAGLVNAIVAIANEVTAPAVPPTPVATK